MGGVSMNHDLANEIRSKVDIIDIIGERIPLVARGKNFFCVCPFHDDSNPSMCVSREKQIYTCFSCHATGNVFTFLMNYEHMEFREALRYLGEKVGISIADLPTSPKHTKNDKLYQAYQFSVKYFQNNLFSEVGREARNYLIGRGISEEVMREFEIGLSLDSRADLTDLLMKKEYNLATLNKIGLSNDASDVYRDRIMFPLYDVSGKAVAFSGRIYRNKDQSKYVNTKETEIFKKGELLYHYHIAKEECRTQKFVIVMEGFMDVIRASTIGYRNTVALMGTALTKEQLQLLKRLSSNVIFCLDGDDPGVHATLSIGDALLEQGIEIKVVVLPDEEDPDSYILKNGKEKFEQLVQNALSFPDFKLRKIKEKVDFRNDEEKANYIYQVLEEYVKIDDPIRIEILLKKLAKEFDIGYNTLEMRFQELKSKSVPKKNVQIITQPKTVKKDKYEKAVEQVLYFMLNNDWVISQVTKEHIVFPTEASRILASEISYFYQTYGTITVADFYTYVQQKEDILVLLNSVLAGSYHEHTTKEELFEYFRVIHQYRCDQEIERLTSLMKKEVDPLEQAKIGDKIRRLRMGES